MTDFSYTTMRATACIEAAVRDAFITEDRLNVANGLFAIAHQLGRIATIMEQRLAEEESK